MPGKVESLARSYAYRERLAQSLPEIKQQLELALADRSAIKVGNLIVKRMGDKIVVKPVGTHPGQIPLFGGQLPLLGEERSR